MTSGSSPDFPPRLRGEATSGDPMPVAVARAEAGTDPGLIVHEVTPARLRAALVLAPEVPLVDAMAMVLAAANAFADAFGALAPSEVAAQFDWPGGIRINGARCGEFRAAASTRDPDAEPDWLVIALDVHFFDETGAEPGEAPDRTTLWEEGCRDIEPGRMLESWSRHLLVWMTTWEDDGMKPLHRDWLGRAAGVGGEMCVPLDGTGRGVFVGLDDRGGLLLRAEDGIRHIPLTRMLEAT